MAKTSHRSQQLNHMILMPNYAVSFSTRNDIGLQSLKFVTFLQQQLVFLVQSHYQ